MNPTMTFIGLAFMIRKDYYWKLGGYTEEWGKYGYDGPEWSLKVWLDEKYPGKVLLRKDVICGHVFGEDKGPEFVQHSSEPSMSYEMWRQTVLGRWGQRAEKFRNNFFECKTVWS